MQQGIVYWNNSQALQLHDPQLARHDSRSIDGKSQHDPPNVAESCLPSSKAVQHLRLERR
ncbi:hypothetical protein E2C01_017969 [Portunus trituberculatus]|uniref:Uncharacterized protein n=1 Tax=Portunus trituberculatus TaxID=210409 RepID=A0A5B7DU89_PORTR|nr:hypothetical protein [Portunus trituberculatus]